MSGQDWLCSICSERKSTSFCYCNEGETFLCNDCFIEHYKNNPFQVHMTAPMPAYGHHRTHRYFERLQSRLMNIPPAKDEMLRSLRKMEECILEFERTMESIIALVNKYKESTLENLRKEKMGLERCINEAIAEVDRTIYEEEPVLNSKLGKDLRDFKQGETVMSNFIYKLDQTKVIVAIESMFEYFFFAPQLTLPGIRENKLWLYNLETEMNTSFTLMRSFSKGLRLCFIRKQSILVVGSAPPTKEAYIITLPKVEVVEIKSMQTARKLPGLIAVGEFAYVFGGNCMQCEKLKIPTIEWSQLPSLQKVPKPLSPVLKNEKIYLVDVVSPIEVFDITSQTFYQIALSFEPLHHEMLSFELNGEIIIITNNKQFVKWRFGESSLRTSQLSSQGEIPMSQCLPLLLGTKVFFVSWNNASLNCFDLDKNACCRKVQ